MWRSVLVVVVLCVLVDSQAPRPAKVSVQSTTRAATKTQIPAARINYKSVKRSPIATLMLANETVEASSTNAPTGGKPSSARNR